MLGMHIRRGGYERACTIERLIGYVVQGMHIREGSRMYSTGHAHWRGWKVVSTCHTHWSEWYRACTLERVGSAGHSQKIGWYGG